MRLLRVISIIFAVGVVVGLSIYLLHKFGLLPPDSPSNYLALLALTVTIIAVVAALFSLGGTVMATRAMDAARQIERDIKGVQKSAEEAQIMIEAAEEEITNLLISVRNSAGAFHPSGHFLSDRIRDLMEHASLKASSEATTFAFVLQELAKIFAANADFGAQIQKLFIGDRDEVKASAMFLSQGPSEYVLSLLEERLSLEKEKSKPDVEIIDFLSRML